MTIEINGVEHDGNLIWLNRWKNPKRAFSNRIAIDGTTVNQHNPIIDNRTIRIGTLNRNGFYGYWTEAQLDAIEELERTGAVIVLQYHTIMTVNVVVIPDTINVSQLTPSITVGYGDAYIGSIDFKVS